MPKGSAELTNARKEEIIAACRTLYETMSFKEITLKEIGLLTSFTRTSIYNYFETKEEIFLALFGQEYELFAEELDGLCDRCDKLSLDELASELARPSAISPPKVPTNSRLERLVEFKTAYGASSAAVDRCLRKFVPDLGEEGRQTFLYAFLPFVFGLYPYTEVTEKQKQAMKKAGIPFVCRSTYEMAYPFIRTVLGGLQ